MNAPTIAETINEIQAALRDYIEATYHIGHPTLIAQREDLLLEEGVLFRAPFFESTPRYQGRRKFAGLELDPAVQTLFNSLTQEPRILFDPPYTHQAEAVESATRDGRSLVITTGTGSGKTESFLLPMLAKLAAEAANRPDSFAEPAIRTLVLYPMNALVNDQLGRLRLLLGDPRVTAHFEKWAHRPARFARYTSRTLYPGVRTKEKDQRRLKPIDDFYIYIIDQANDLTSPWHDDAVELLATLGGLGKWPAKPDLKAWYGEKGTHWTNSAGEFVRAVLQPHDPELLTRDEVLRSPPDVLITNYSMLEYMMMRPLERPVFDATRKWLADHPAETFLLIIDEAHLYRGAGGAEVALLLRRLRSRLNISADRLQVICTSASFNDPDNARQFAAQLSGKSVGDFRTVEGRLEFRQSAGLGTSDDAKALGAVPLADYYAAETNEGRQAAVSGLLEYRSVPTDLSKSVGELLFAALESFGPMGLLVNETMEQARPVDELGATLFPDVDPQLASRAASTLIALGSAARKSVDDAGLLPCRVHAFFRGLPGLWACLDPECPVVDRQRHPDPGPVGMLYAQPRATCDCGARVFELYTCRHCGSAYARTYTSNVEEPDYLWHEPGGAFQSVGGSITELSPLDLLLEPPAAGAPEPADLDLVTGRLRPGGQRMRSVFIPPADQRTGQVTRGGSSDEGEEDDGRMSYGEFKPCGVCGESARFGRSSVQDHQTKGDQPFQALVTRQIKVQPPGTDYTDFAPLRGRKVLVFSDSRQVAARLAPNLQTYAMRDVMRPLILRGWTDMSTFQGFGQIISLDKLFVSVMVGAKRLGVRLRPELKPGESMAAIERIGRLIDEGALEGNLQAQMELVTITDLPPQSLLRAIYATLTDRYYGLAQLGLASIRELGKASDELTKLPDIAGIATSANAKLALVRLWLAQWAVPSRGIWFPGMDSSWVSTRGGVKPSNGTFTAVANWLEAPAAKTTFKNKWLPSLLSTFCEPLGGNKYRLLANRVALQLDGDWGYCQRCRYTQRPFPGINRCESCLSRQTVLVIDPTSDPVFQARKGYYRSSSARALNEPPESPMNIIAAEHTAQLNAAQSDEVFSKAEEYELLFQDVDITLPGSDEMPLSAIDVLSCTTTMEVGIDIGKLSGVALRNMPPSRANYQQRAGRAGRRGNAVATVLAFGSADTHDDHYFREPAEMIRGRVDDPELTLDNDEIARRHVNAYLLQRYNQDRLPDIAPDDQPQLFEVLGTVDGFLGTTSPLNRTDFAGWLRENEETLRAEVDGWLPSELAPIRRQVVLDGIVDRTLRDIDTALDTEPATVSAGGTGE
ncbi:DEAD/DEAH box helicase [Mycobacteroides immunogenum]|uniref:DEAD/DEAH box helicase n=1 Tax=Mycobacteroides immunogenum TaxID=83262 RepID=UPI0025B78427|nr:DEAD/DEAH box helicase [Mycobacteroides immunogenum]WJR32509.1 DEAD/DEAH box helicase [Mycobacteroides immunogenum]